MKMGGEKKEGRQRRRGLRFFKYKKSSKAKGG